MTYASINEVWGGVSGNNQLTTPLEKTRHPIHQKQIDTRQRQNFPEPREHTSKDLYQCKYGSHDCEQIFKQNQTYNNNKKQVAAGVQPFLPQSPMPHNYTFSPQYPWNPWAREGYMMYGPQQSQMWYTHPFQYNPGVANQILMQQMYGGINYMTPTGPYYPQGFMPLPPQYNVNPPLMPPKQIQNSRSMFGRKRRENFGEDAKSDAIRAGMIYFIFFLVALAVILCIFMICIVSTNYNS